MSSFFFSAFFLTFTVTPENRTLLRLLFVGLIQIYLAKMRMATKHVDIWAHCLRTIKEEISEQSFDTWFRPIKPVRLEQNVLTIEVPSQFFMSGWKSTTLVC